MKPAPGSAKGPVLIGHVLFGADELVARFVRDEVKGYEKSAGWGAFHALGVVRDGELIGGVVFHDYRPMAQDIEISAAFSHPRWCTPATLKTILAYPLKTLALQRATARTAESNMEARSFLERLGFRQEGRLRRGFNGHEDMLIYGVLREEGRWPRLASP